MNFLPKEYEMPIEAGDYLNKFEEGPNSLRILSSAVIGWRWWVNTEDGRGPRRVKTHDEVPSEFLTGKDKAKHFWAFVVYNYRVKQVQILEITQKTIMRDIRGLVKNPKWGDPKEYDIVITKTKTGSRDMDVEYAVVPEPKEALDEGILQYYKDLDIELEALYSGDDPFGKSEDDVGKDTGFDQLE